MPRRRLLVPLALWLLFGCFVLGCGQILTRAGTPTPRSGFAFATPTVTPTADTSATATPVASIAALATATPTAAPPTITPTPVPPPPSNVQTGAPARVLFGMNVRESPSVNATRLGQYLVGQVVTVEGGPVLADNYRWWQVVDRTGLRGWVADGAQGATWLDANVGEPRRVSRAVAVGDTVEVTAAPQMSIRYQPGTDAQVARSAAAGERFTVRDGPRDVDGLRWWFIVDSRNREYWGAEGRGNERWLTPIE